METTRPDQNGARTLWLMRKLVDVTTTSDQAWYTENANN
jgi:hypothetical protein